jgi:hypothetical protein
MVALDSNAAVLGSNLSPSQPTANFCQFLGWLPPGVAQYHELASEGQQRCSKYTQFLKTFGKETENLWMDKNSKQLTCNSFQLLIFLEVSRFWWGVITKE